MGGRHLLSEKNLKNFFFSLFVEARAQVCADDMLTGVGIKQYIHQARVASPEVSIQHGEYQWDSL